jgi:hypothetical protein
VRFRPPPFRRPSWVRVGLPLFGPRYAWGLSLLQTLSAANRRLSAAQLGTG